MDDWTLRREALEVAVRCGAGPCDLIAMAREIEGYLAPQQVNPVAKRGPNGSRWTPERKAYVAREFPIDTPVPVMLDALNLMAGPLVTRTQLNTYANYLGLRRANPSLSSVKMLAGKAAKAANGVAAH